MQKTLVLLKPDISKDVDIVEAIVDRLQTVGKLTASKVVNADRRLILSHYNKDEVWLKKQGERKQKQILANGGTPSKTHLQYGQEIMDQIVEYMTKDIVIVMIFESENVVADVRDVVGLTEPFRADANSIRGIYSSDSYEQANTENRAIHNVIHCSDSVEEAEREIRLWIKEYS